MKGTSRAAAGVQCQRVRAGLRHAVGESLKAGDLRGRAGICSEDIHTTIKAIDGLAISGLLQQTVKGKYYENKVIFMLKCELKSCLLYQIISF